VTPDEKLMQDMRALVQEILPDAKVVMPNDPEFFATTIVSTMVHGQAAFLRRTDIPWSDLAVDPERREKIADEMAAVADRLMDET